MIYSSISDTGKERQQNQDNYSNLITKEYALFVIADGMGGHNAGDVASKIAVEAIRDYIYEREEIFNYEDLLENAIIYANNMILEKSKLEPDYKNMGTTIVCVMIVDETAYISHLGDSRLYKFSKEDRLEQITKDDSYLQSLKDEGVENINETKYKNVITKALGVDSNPDINHNQVQVKKGDYLLLATDGLTNMVEDCEIEEVISFDLDLKEAVEILVYMANSSGGYDNITMTLVKI